MLEPRPMASGPWTTRRVFELALAKAPGCWRMAGLRTCGLTAVLLAASLAQAQTQAPSQAQATKPGQAQAASACAKPLYLTFDTGHMEVAPLVADAQF